MLTFDDFKEKHHAKFAQLKLDNAAIRRRYDDYKSQERANAGGPPAKPVAQKHLSAHKTSAPRGSLRQQEISGMALTQAMLDPFTLANSNTAPPRIPDGEFAVTVPALLTENVNLFSDSSGRVALVYRCSPWAAIAVSSTTSSVDAGDAAYVANLEYNAFAAAVARDGYAEMPQWTQNAWSIPAPPADLPPPYDEYGLQDMPQAGSVFAQAYAWRPVCGGLEFKYTAAALEAKGQIVAAPLPGGAGMPVQSSPVFTLDVDEDTIASTATGVGPTFATVQTLQGAAVYKAVDGIRQIWKPNGTAVQTVWRTVKPRPTGITSSASIGGLIQVSNSNTTGIYVLPPPVVGDPSRMTALIDTLYSTNGWVYANNAEGSVPVLGVSTGTNGYNSSLYFVQDTGAGNTNNEEMAGRKQTAMLDLHRGDMIAADNGIIWVGEGFPPSTLIGTVKVIVGIEYIQDNRNLQIGRSEAQAHAGGRAAQLEAHGVAMRAVQLVPSSKPATSPPTAFLQDVSATIRGGVGVVKDVASGVMEVAQAIGPLLAAFA